MAMIVPDDDDLLGHALRSERIYFALGAEAQSGPGWFLAHMPGLGHLPAANVCLLEPGNRDRDNLDGWIADLEDAFATTGAGRARFYAHQPPAGLEALMTRKGYARKVEVAHAHEIKPGPDGPLRNQSWRPVVSEADWVAKASIHARSTRASDGYDVVPTQWIEMERRKAATGELAFWMLVLDGSPVATAGLIRLTPTMVRVKNFLVRADCRGRGIGKTALLQLFRDTLLPSDRIVVNFSIEGSAGQRLYQSAGAREIGILHEWVRVL